MKTDTAWGVALTGGSILLLWVAYQPQRASLVSDVSIMFWSRMLLWGVLALSLMLLAGALLERRRARDTGSGRALVLRHWAFAAVGVAYLAAIHVIGFLWAALLFCSVAVPLLGDRRPRAIALYAVIFVALVWVLIILGMNVPLPRGTGVFRDLNVHLY